MALLIIDKSELIIERLIQIILDAKISLDIYGAQTLEKALQLFSEIKPAIVLMESNLQHQVAFDFINQTR